MLVYARKTTGNKALVVLFILYNNGILRHGRRYNACIKFYEIIPEIAQMRQRWQVFTAAAGIS